MTSTALIPPITGTVTVSVPIQQAFERVVFTWQINGMWQFDPDLAHASEIEARFRADGPELTVVEVEHRHFERLEGGQGVRDAINGGGGRMQLLDGFAKTVADQR